MNEQRILLQDACGQLKLYFNATLNATITFYNIYSMHMINPVSVKQFYSTWWSEIVTIRLNRLD